MMAILGSPPPPLGPSSNGSVSLSDRINIATRSVHDQLNILILVRLPLALPPFTSNPSTYVSGLLHVAPIYTTFESLWQTIIDSSHLPTSINQTALPSADDNETVTQDMKCSSSALEASFHQEPPVPRGSKVYHRIHSLLSHLRLPGLLRTQRLRDDITSLTKTPESEIEEQLDALSREGRLAEFIAHIKKSVEWNPHVLLAYAWVLYMGVFSGGRYLRAALAEAGGERRDFWDRDPSPVRPYSVVGGAARRRRDISSEFDELAATRFSGRSRSPSESEISKVFPGLQFFNFAGDEDGEDIKLEFKKRVAEAEILLTSGEKEDIITEAEHIFKFIFEIVGDLDNAMTVRAENMEAIGDVQQRPFTSSREMALLLINDRSKEMTFS